jgi:hypothetical protein
MAKLQNVTLRRAAGSAIGSWFAFLFATANAAADPIAIITTPSGTAQTQIVGDDTLNQIMDQLLPSLQLGQINPITGYAGLGNACGQDYMEGNMTNPGDLPCKPEDPIGPPEGNPGCAEISPMGRPMNSGICDDDFTAPNTQNVSGQGIDVAREATVVITDNASARQYADDATVCPPSSSSDNGDPFAPNAAYAGAGKLRASGTITLEDGTSYTLGANGTGWRDVLRLIYTGCNNTQGTCGSVPRLTRCTSVARKTLIDHWEYIQESGAVAGDASVACTGNSNAACGSGADAGLRAAYRRDENSLEAGIFLSLLGVIEDFTTRKTWVGLPGFTAIPSSFGYCDGGQLEGFTFDANPTSDPNPAFAGFPEARSATNPSLNVQGDPITKPCKPEDVLCGYDHRIGVVRAIRSTEGSSVYPPYQCTKSLFDSIQLINTSRRICPDGSVPAAGQCELPYYLDTATNTKHYNCVANLDTKPGDDPSTYDGRMFNWVMKNDTTGAVEFVTAGVLPEIAQWRQHMATLKTTGLKIGGPIPTSSIVCEESDSARNIGCIVGNTTCTMGSVRRDGAATAPYDDLQEPFRLVNTSGTTTAPSDASITTTDVTSAYPFQRSSFLLNAIGGFKNLTADCTARGGSAAFCGDELTIANALFRPSEATKNIIRQNGLVPLDNPGCVSSLAAAGCGDPSPVPDCTPQ